MATVLGKNQPKTKDRDKVYLKWCIIVLVYGPLARRLWCVGLAVRIIHPIFSIRSTKIAEINLKYGNTVILNCPLEAMVILQSPSRTTECIIARRVYISIYIYIKFVITITSWFDNLSHTQKSNIQSNVVQWIGSESNPPFQDASTCLLLELSRHYLHKLKKVARLACTHLLNKSGSAWKEHRLRMQPIFLSFWMSVKLVNSRRPSDSEFHLKLFLEIFRHVSMKRCIIVRRAIGIQVFIFNFWMSDNLQVKTMFWLSISPQALFPKMSDTLRTGSVL